MTGDYVNIWLSFLEWTSKRLGRVSAVAVALEERTNKMRRRVSLGKRSRGKAGLSPPRPTLAGPL